MEEAAAERWRLRLNHHLQPKACCDIPTSTRQFYIKDVPEGTEGAMQKIDHDPMPKSVPLND